MNKLIIPFLFIACLLMTACSDDDNITPIDLNLFAGTWEVVESDADNRGCIYEIKTASDHTEGTYGGYYGTINTYYLSVAGNPVLDKEYTWSSRDLDNHQPLLDLTLTGEIDSEDPWTGSYYYKITKLTDTYMWWKGNSNGDNGVIKFKRRNPF